MGLAEKYKVTATQVIFAWHLSRGNILICKSESDARQKENITVSYKAPVHISQFEWIYLIIL